MYLGNKLKNCPIDYNVENCSSKDFGFDCTNCLHMTNIEAELDNLFENHIITTLLNTDPLKVDILRLIQKIIPES